MSKTQEEVTEMKRTVERGIGHFELVKLFERLLVLISDLHTRVEKLEEKKEGTP